jgi:hypothetical protein
MSTAKRVDQRKYLNSIKEISIHLSIYFNSCYQELLAVACSRGFVTFKGVVSRPGCSMDFWRTGEF